MSNFKIKNIYAYMDKGSAELFSVLTKKRERLSKLIKLRAPQKIVDAEKNMIREAEIALRILVDRNKSKEDFIFQNRDQVQ